MNYIKTYEFFNLFKKENKGLFVELDESGWVKWSEREPDTNSLLESYSTYNINESGDREKLRDSNFNMFKYKIILRDREVKNGFLYHTQNEWSDRNTYEKLDNQLDRMGDVYWFDFTKYKLKMEELMDSNGYIIGLPVELISLEHRYASKKKDKHRFHHKLTNKEYFHKNYGHLLNKGFIINTIRIWNGENTISASVFINGDWVPTTSIKPLK
jgi:hypothetical protein